MQKLERIPRSSDWDRFRTYAVRVRILNIDRSHSHVDVDLALQDIAAYRPTIQLLRNLRHLRLDLHGPQRLHSAEIVFFSPTIIIFEAGWFSGETEEVNFLQHVLQNCDRLRSVRFTGAEWFEDGTVVELLAVFTGRMASLEYVDIDLLKFDSPTLFYELSLLPRLRSLSITSDYYVGVIDSAFPSPSIYPQSEYVSDFPCLQRLRLRAPIWFIQAVTSHIRYKWTN
jgi:hypothetical protein